MVHPSPRTPLQLSENDPLGLLTVDAANFAAFEDELDERLAKLEKAWKHMAAPNSQRIHRGSIPAPQK
jgi:hypothetical protein